MTTLLLTAIIAAGCFCLGQQNQQRRTARQWRRIIAVDDRPRRAA